MKTIFTIFGGKLGRWVIFSFILTLSSQAIAQPCAVVPNLSLSGGGAFCAGSTTTIQFNITGGTPPWRLVYSINGVNQPQINNIFTSPYVLTTGTAGTFAGVDVYDANNCLGTVSGSPVTTVATPMPTVDAGTTIQICDHGPVYLNGIATNYSSVVWTSTGNGIFSDPNSLTSLYWPDESNISSGKATLTLTAYAVAPCTGSVSDQLEVLIDPGPTVNAGPDAVNCGTQVFTTSATAADYSSAIWTTSGTGTFLNATNVNTTYTPSASDVAAGSVTLTLTVYGQGDCITIPISDDIVLQINEMPTANAGAPALVCEGSNLTINDATASNYSSLNWSTSGSGAFSSNGILNPTYIPSAADINSGLVILTLTAGPLAPCAIPATSTKIVTFSVIPTVYAGTDGSVCDDSPYTITNAQASDYTSVLWTTSGSGYFTNPTSITSTYMPDAFDVTTGSVTITLTAFGDPSCSLSASDIQVLTLVGSPVVNAGNDQTACENTTITINGASASNYSSISWTTSGTGTLVNANTLSPSYTPSHNDALIGTVVLTLSATGNNPCTGVISDPVQLTVIALPSVNAGNDLTVCNTNPITLTGASATSFSSVSWSTSGTGIFSNANIINTTYIPSNDDVLLGNVTLTLTATPLTPCAGSVSDNVRITIMPFPSANAGFDNTSCDGIYTVSGASAANYSSLLWITSGTGILTGQTTLSPTYVASAQDIANGSVTLILTAQSLAPCNSPTTDAMQLLLPGMPVAEAGIDASVCEGSSFQITTASALNYGSLNWTTAGSGTFALQNTLYPVYYPSAADIANGSVILTLTATSEAPCTSMDDDQMTLTINQGPEVNAGNNVTICENGTATLNGTVYNNSSFAWSTSGDGTFANAGTLTPTYTPGSIDKSAGSVTITLTAFPTGVCNIIVSDYVIITINSSPFVDAGGDKTSCDDIYTLVSAAASEYSILQWSTSGSGNFINGNTPNATYLASQADITAGSVTLSLTATGVPPCTDIVFDQMVLTLTPEPTVFAGMDGSTCGNISYTIADASAANYSIITWSTSGSGVFSSSSSVNPTYYPSESDFNAGFVTLTLTATGYNLCNLIADDEMVLFFNDFPSADAGSDVFSCGTNPIQINGASATNFNTIYWTHDGSGVIQGINSLSPVYIPSQADIADGQVVLTLHVTANAPCTGEVTDDLIITLEEGATVSAGNDITICEGQQVILANATATGYVTVTWTTSGTGTFSSTSVLNPVYTPSNGDIAAGNVVLTLSVTGASPCNNPISDVIIVTIEPSAKVNAGPDVTSCNSSYFLSQATAQNYSLINWTTSGTGSFSNASVVNTVYTPSAADILIGSVTLTITATGINPCINVAADAIVLTLGQEAMANAGADANTCGNSPFMVTTSSSSTQSSISWTSSGTGTFSDENTLNPTYIPSSDDIAAGSVVLYMLVQGPAPCFDIALDDMILTISESPFVNAGPDASICEGSSFTITGASGSDYSGLMWTTTGSGTFTSANTLSPTYIPSADDILAGSVTLGLSGVAVSPCTGSAYDELLLTISTGAQVDAGPDAEVCYGNSYTVTGATATGATTYIWTTNGSGTLSNANTLNPTYLPSNGDRLAGSVILTLNGNSGAPCLNTASDFMALAIGSTPAGQAVISGPIDICAGQTGIIYTVIPPVQYATSYLWTVPAGATIIFGNGTSNITVDFGSSATSGNLTVTPSSSCGTGSTGTLAITVDELPLTPGAITGPDELCGNTSGVIYSVEPVTGTDDYNWTVPGGATIVAGQGTNVITVDFGATATPGNITVTTANGCGNGGSSVLAVNVFPVPTTPVITANGPVNFCEGGSVTLTATAGYASYLWSNGLTAQSIIVNLPGTYSVVVTDANGCSSLASNEITVTVNSLESPDVTINGPTTLCEGGNVVLTAEAGFASYLWNTGATSQSITVTTSGNYFVIATDNLGCETQPSANITVTVYPVPESPIITANGPTTLCFGQTVTIMAPAGYASYLWSNGETDQFINTANAGDYYVIVTDNNGCQSAASNIISVTVTDLPVVNAGFDATVCESLNYTLSGAVAINCSSIYWTTSGSGSFNDPALLNAVYTPSVLDIQNGTVVLTLTGIGCEQLSDNLILTIVPKPVATGGQDQDMCFEPTAVTGVTATNYSLLNWTVTFGTGTLSNANTTTPVYFPGAGDLIAGYAILTLTVQPVAPCSEPLVINKTLNIHAAPIVNSGYDSTICAGSSVIINTATASNYTSLQWSSSGTGTWLNANSLNPTYFPSNADVLIGSVTLTLTADNEGCPSESDYMVLTLQNEVAVYAGPDGISCEGTNFNISGTSASMYSTLLWTTSGTGTFSNPAVMNPVYTPSPADIANGSVQLTLTGTSALPCNGTASDVLTLVINQEPLANAGSDGIICQGEQYLITDAIASDYSTLTWISSGSGIFLSGNTLNPVYIPSQLDVLAGSVTLTLIASNPPCADVTDYQTLTITPLATVEAGPDAYICQTCSYTVSGAFVNDAISFSWTTTGTGTYNNTNTLTPTYQPSAGDIANGSVTLILSAESAGNCGSFSDQLVIYINQNPNLDFTWEGACENLPTAFTVDENITPVSTIAIWHWDFGDGIYSNMMNPVHTFPASGQYTITLTATDINGNQTSVSHIIEIQSTPIAFFSIETPNCFGDETQFINLSSTETGYITHWIWDYNDGSPIDTIVFPDDPNVTHTYAATGIYGVTLTVRNSFGCENTFYDEVTITNAPVANFYYSSSCQDMLVSFQDASFPNGSGNIVGWNWDFGDPGSGIFNNSNLENPQHIFSEPGTYTVTLYVLNFNNCSDTITKQVNAGIAPPVAFTWESGCANTTTIFFADATVININAVADWLWNFGDGGQSTLQNPQHAYVASGVYNVTLTITDTAGCINSVTNLVTVNEGPVAYFSFSDPNCQQSEVVFTNLSSTESGYITSWEWNFGDGNASVINFPNDPNVSHEYASSGSYNVTLTVTTSEGCAHSVTRMITVIPNPVANFTYNSSCIEIPVTFNDQSQANGGGQIINWVWDFGDPASGTGNTSVVQNPQHIYAQAGTYPVLLTIATSNSCTDTISRTVVINPAPIVEFSSTSACTNDPVLFNSSSYVNMSTTTEWLWDFGDGSTSTTADPEHLYANTGTYNVTLTITDMSGCFASVSHSVIVVSGPTPQFTYQAPGCTGNSVQFNDMSNSNGSQIMSWIWNFGDGNSITINAPANPDVTHEYTSTGTYTVTLTISNMLGCEAVTSHFVTIVPGPTANYTYESGCQGTPVQFTDQTNTNGGTPITQWAWNFDDPASGVSNTSNLQNPQHIFSAPGIFNVVLITTNASGCTDTIAQNVMINAPAPAAFNYSVSCSGQPVSFEPDLNVMTIGNIVSWNWDFGDGSAPSNLMNPIHVYAVHGSYTVTMSVVNTEGCESSSSEIINVSAMPVATFNASSTCSGSQTFFTDYSYSPTGEPIVAWHWRFGDPNAIGGADTSNLQNPVYQYSKAGMYDVELTITSASGCSSTIVRSIEVVPGPEAAFMYITNACQNGTVAFRDQSSSYMGTIQSWEWEFEPNYYSNLQNPQHTFSYSDSCYNVRLVVTDILGCTDTLFQEVCVPAGLQVAVDYNNTCFGDTTSFNPILIAPLSTSLISFEWNFDDPGSGFNNTSTERTPLHFFASPGSYLVSLTATDINNCEVTVYTSIEVKALPQPGFTFNAGSCDSTLYFIDLSNANGTDIISWIWNFGDGSTDTIYAAPANISHYYATSGNFDITLTNMTSDGCSNSFSMNIEKLPCILAGFIQLDTLICEKHTLTFADNSFCGNPISKWTWYFGDGNSLSYDVYQPTIEHLFSSNGVFDVSLVVSTIVSGITVTDTLTQSVVVLASPIADFAAENVCVNSATNYIDMSQSVQSKISTWSWDFGDYSSAIDTSTISDPVYTYPLAGVYHPTLTITNALGCSDTISKEIQVHNFPIADFTYGLSCQNNHTYFIDLSDSIESGISQWWWQFKDSLNMLGLAGIQNPDFIFEHTGDYEVQLMVVNGNGCADTASKTITVHPKPTSLFTISENYENTQGRIRLINESEGALAYFWNFGLGTASFETDPIVTYSNEGEYEISLISLNEYDCPDTLTINYTMIFKGLWIPNAFSPNNPNEEVRLFKPVGRNLQSYTLEIYDTWGNLLWKTNKIDENGSPAEGWNGVFNGNLLPQDTYMWKASAVFKDGSIWDGASVGKNDNLPGKPYGTVQLIR